MDETSLQGILQSQKGPPPYMFIFEFHIPLTFPFVDQTQQSVVKNMVMRLNPNPKPFPENSPVWSSRREEPKHWV